MSRNLIKEGITKVVGGWRKEFPILEGHPIGQQHGEEVVKSIENLKRGDDKCKEFRIYRWSPHNPNQKPYFQSFFVHLPSCGPMVCPLMLTFYCVMFVVYNLISRKCSNVCS